MITPHKRGGKNTQGDLGCHHDFVMACIMQNTMNAYFSINELNIKTASFEKTMIELLKSYIYILVDYSLLVILCY